MTTEVHCPTKLLADTPAETDAFGGHERVASSIVEVVQTEVGGRSIGLEGGWGAGKSTIVKLTSKKLAQAKECDYRVAEFDIWAHQNDPLRRTFLENLITRIQEFRWVNKKRWDRNVAGLTRRRREDTTRVVPKLTGAGIGFALTLLCIPVGSALISAGAALLASQNASGALLLPLGIAGVVLPAIYYGIMAGFRLLNKNSKTEEGDGDERLKELPSLVTGQASTESRTIVTQTPDPTSVEFESVFRDLLSEALKPENRKLLLVIDNLDRVQPSDALSIWSTLQTFLGHSDYRQSGWIDRLWILIPYDGNAILRLWNGSGSDSQKADSSTLAKSFLDKTFQLRFEVPPLLLLNWRGFLQDALQQALPNHEEVDFHDVYRAFAVNGGLEKSAPTPRGLKIFVNQLGALHRAWQDKFPLSNLACYVLVQNQKGGENIHDALLSKTALELPRRFIGEQWREVFAALHFGVPPEEARQHLLRGPIEVALANGDGNSLSDLALVHPAGFWTVLEDSVPAGAENWNTLNPTEIAKAVTALGGSGVFDHEDSPPEATAMLTRIRATVAEMRAWTPFDASNAAGMVEVARLVGESKEIIPSLLAGASNAPVEAPGGPPRAVSPTVWMASAFTLIEGLVDLGFGNQVREGLKVPLSAQQWLDVALEVAKQDPDGQLLQYFELQDITEIDQLLANQVATNQMAEVAFSMAQIAMATKSRNAMKKVASEVFIHLQSGQGFQGDQLAFMVRTLRSSKAAGLIKEDEYLKFATSGYYLHHLHYAVLRQHPEATGECLFGYLQAVPDASEPSSHIGNSNAGYGNLNQLLQDPNRVSGAAAHFIALVKETQQLRVVFEMAGAKRPVRPFVAEVLRALLTDVTNELVIANWSVIRDILQEKNENSQSFEMFLKESPRLDTLVSRVVDDVFDVGDSGLYVALLRNNAGADFETWCGSGLSSVNKDAWTRELTSQGELIELAIELKTRRANVALSVGYVDALTEYAKSVAEGIEEVFTDETWRELFTLLNDDRQEVLPRRVYEILEESNGEVSEKFFSLFGDMLSNRKLLSNKPRFIDQVCRPILGTGNGEGIAWLADVVDSDPSLLIRHKDRAGVNDFKDRVQQHLNDIPEGDPTLLELKKIGAAFGIEREDSAAES